MRVGYNTNGLAHHRLEDGLRLLADHGYQAVALTPDVPHLDPFTATATEVGRIAALLERLGLAVVIETGARFLLDPARKHRPGLIELDLADRRRRVDFLRRCLALGVDLGAEVLSFFAGALPAEVDASLGQRLLIDGVAEITAAATAAGLRAGLEPEPGHAIATVAEFLALRRQVGSELGLVLDVGHLLVTGEGDPTAVIASQGDNLVQVHLEDIKRGVHEHLLPGEGDLDFGAVKQALQDAGYRGTVCFEVSRSSHQAPTAIARCMACWLQGPA
jgi:sugar phosphate isomerase/epimerase